MRIDRTLTSAPQQWGDYTLTTNVRMSGWQWQSDSGAQAAAVVQLLPTEMLISHDGGEQHIALTHPTAEPLRGMAQMALAIAGVSLLIMLVARLVRRR